MEELKKECDTRVEEYAQLLDIRAERIKVRTSLVVVKIHIIIQFSFPLGNKIFLNCK